MTDLPRNQRVLGRAGARAKPGRAVTNPWQRKPYLNPQPGPNGFPRDITQD